MDTERIKEILAKIPTVPLLLAWLLYIGFDFYTFRTDPGSPLAQKATEIRTANATNEKLKTKIQQLETFRKNLEAKKMEIRNSTMELDSMKTTLTEKLDVPDFMKTTLTEAKRAGLTVTGLHPTTNANKEYYFEQAFDLKFRGAYVQLLAFLERLSNMQKLVRVDNFQLRPTGSPVARIVELEGTVQIKTYRYLGSKADEVATKSKGGDQ